MDQLGWTVIFVMLSQTPLDVDSARYLQRTHVDWRHPAPPAIEAQGLNHGGAGELCFGYTYVEADSPPKEFDLRVTVIDPATRRIVARDVRHIQVRRIRGAKGAVYFEPKGPDPQDSTLWCFMTAFRRKLPPGKYRVTISAGGVVSVKRDYVVR